MRRFFISGLILALGSAAQAADPAGDAATGSAVHVAPAPTVTGAPAAVAPAAPPNPAEQDRVMYALGQMVGKNLDSLSLSPHELLQVKKGLSDAATGKAPVVDMNEYGPKVQALAKERQMAALERTKAAGRAFLEKAAAEPGVTRTSTGILIKTLTEGTGASPQATDQVKVNYEGRLISGKIFDSSAQHGGPATFRLNQVVQCWTAAVQTMKVGGKSHVVCPAETAYGDRTMGDIKAGSTLAFDIELIDIVK